MYRNAHFSISAMSGSAQFYFQGLPYWRLEPVMSDAPSDTSQSFTRIPITIDGDAIARAASLAIGLREDGHVFELPRGFSNNCHLPSIFVIRMV